MATPKYDILADPPKALTFDVFGTVVNWRKTVTETLISSAASKTTSSSDVSPQVRKAASELSDQDWGTFAQEWRNSYKKFVQGYNPDSDPWRDIDTHHRLSLIEQLEKSNLTGLYNEQEIAELSRIWHFLEPWPEAPHGLELLGKKFTTSTLSNGTQSLLKDLDTHGKLGFKLLQSSEDFKAYKPHPKTYQGAASKLGLRTDEVAMVAAHLGDLKAARGQGMRTIYVERLQEEDWDPTSKEYADAKGWVDLWISEHEDGFVEVAKRFGVL